MANTVCYDHTGLRHWELTWQQQMVVKLSVHLHLLCNLLPVRNHRECREARESGFSRIRLITGGILEDCS